MPTRCSSSNGLFLYGLVGKISTVDSISKGSEHNHDAQDYHYISYFIEASFNHEKEQSRTKENDRKDNGDRKYNIHCLPHCFKF